MKQRNIQIAYFIIIVFIILLLTACGSKSVYVLSNSDLQSMQISAIEYAEMINDPSRSDLPKEKYGTVYANDNGDLCFELTDKQLDNWRAREQHGWDGIKEQLEADGMEVQYDEMNHILTVKYHTAINDVGREEAVIKGLTDDFIWSQFFADPKSPVQLTTLVKDKDDNLLGEVKWPDDKGYFYNLDH